jgi:predicted RNase H-like HicB family nuclease
MRHAVVVEKAAHNYSAYVPDLPGCVAAAETEEDVFKLIREAIDLHLESLPRGRRAGSRAHLAR